jgi:hypothetical protein
MAAKRPKHAPANSTRSTVEKRVEEDRARFLEIFRARRSVLHTCRAMGIHRSTVYLWRKDEGFAAAMDAIDKELDDDLEDSARHRATFGLHRGIYHDGELVGQERHFETALTIFMLKARKKGTYQFGLDAMGPADAEKAKAIRAMVSGIRTSIEGPPDEARPALDQAPPSS